MLYFSHFIELSRVRLWRIQQTVRAKNKPEKSENDRKEYSRSLEEKEDE